MPARSRAARAVSSVFAALLLLAPARATFSEPAAPSAQAGATALLHQLFKRDWDRQMREDPLSASDYGDRRFNALWPDMSLAEIKREHKEDEQTLTDLAKIDRKDLDAQDRINYDLFKWQHQDSIESYRFHEYLFPLNQLSGIQTVGDMATQSLTFATLKDYQDWLERLRTFGPYMDQTIALLRLGLKDGYTLPKVVAARIPPQIKDNIVADPAQSPFYAPFKSFPASIDAKTAARLRQEAAQAVTQVIVPAYRRLDDFFVKTYLPGCRTSIAARDLPNGKAYYAYLVRHFTTTDMTPAQVRALGLKKMAEIKKQMLDVIKQTGFKGSFHDFLHYLRTNPKFYYTDPADLLEAYRAQGKAIDPLLVKEFGHLPSIPWGIEPIPADQAPNTYTAYSEGPSADGTRAAIMSVNLYKPETRPKYEIPVLTCHEGRPGHALQLSLAAEMTGLPKFRRFSYYNAYGEGWAVYCETLCGEMGVYDTPYKRFGELSYQMWRAARLVADTGIHYYGMSRQDAVQLLRDNTALSDENINAEVDRYIAWPGQALSYMIGEIDIQ
ncbi:MAG TPA: DUF885 domain-containing protein, partial [Elusimicrobiota bacterium]|nr:DUF885 domain-containing protein [Elusimicrobiota bacterium]